MSSRDYDDFQQSRRSRSKKGIVNHDDGPRRNKPKTKPRDNDYHIIAKQKYRTRDEWMPQHTGDEEDFYE